MRWMRKKYFMLLLFLVGMSLSPISLAMFNPYALLNYLQDFRTAINSATTAYNTTQQVRQELNAIRYQATNTRHVSNYQWQNISGLIQQLDQATRQGQAISYSMSNVDQRFRQTYPNYTHSSNNPMNYSQAYHGWNATTLDTLRSTLDAAGMAANHYKNESELLQQLRQQGRTAQGRMQVLQISSEIVAENVNQMQELKRLVVAQTNSQNAYMAYQVSKDSYSEKSLEAINSHVKTAFPKYHNNANFGMLPYME